MNLISMINPLTRINTSDFKSSSSRYSNDNIQYKMSLVDVTTSQSIIIRFRTTKIFIIDTNEFDEKLVMIAEKIGNKLTRSKTKKFI